MTDFDSSSIDQMMVHLVGNKHKDEALTLSNQQLKTSEEISELLLRYFTKPFKQREWYTFYDEHDVNHNSVYRYVRDIFADPASLQKNSELLATRLFEKSLHPNIKGGEFFVVYFCDCVVDGELTDAIGLFKSENKDAFLKVYPENEVFSVKKEEGINIHKLDKGCLIFNTEMEKGYMVSVVDNVSKGNDAVYWVDDFLQLMQRADDYFYTNQAIHLCKEYVTKQLPQEFSIDKADQAEILNRSADYFKEHETFDVESYAADVMQQVEVIDSFKNYKNTYADEHQVSFEESFDINPSAVKKQAKNFKSVIKLDKNFHIYIHGKREYVEKGFDESRGLHYYKLFYEEEN